MAQWPITLTESPSKPVLAKQRKSRSASVRQPPRLREKIKRSRTCIQAEVHRTNVGQIASNLRHHPGAITGRRSKTSLTNRKVPSLAREQRQAAHGSERGQIEALR